MRLVDTSAWIEWLIASKTGMLVGAKLPAKIEWLVPTIVQLELAKWLTREVSEEKADEVIAFTQLCVIAPLDTKIALSAADLSRQHRLATADAIVYATALEHAADILTCDTHFKGLQGVLLFAKSSKRSR